MIAIDLGSNSLRILEYDCTSHKQIFASEKVVKTADGLAEFGTVNDEAVARIIATIHKSCTKTDRFF